jgi:thiol:disulfide interchange protein
MQRLQRFLAIPMAASAVAALWLLYRQSGDRGLVAGLIAGLLIAALLFTYGRIQRRTDNIGWAVAGLFVALTVIAITRVPPHVERPAAAIAGAEPWSEARVARDLAQGHPVFVYFTADWCLTCKANEAAAIDRGEVRDAFKHAGVKVLAGDWTNGDPAITRFLESRDRAGVPLYLWYSPGREAEELPQILAPSELISRARSAKR